MYTQKFHVAASQKSKQTRAMYTTGILFQNLFRLHTNLVCLASVKVSHFYATAAAIVAHIVFKIKTGYRVS